MPLRRVGSGEGDGTGERPTVCHPVPDTVHQPGKTWITEQSAEAFGVDTGLGFVR
ncbi:hypothetical protein GCM10010308_14910 [Streptomyces vinaceusdrappus]|nr:hypothetical protein GCM10010301_18600 [Streptomyces plicatus]GHC03419.1 hypothetical protein GCM10010308_14910 [Streptomyces vinaceusdrappus]